MPDDSLFYNEEIFDALIIHEKPTSLDARRQNELYRIEKNGWVRILRDTSGKSDKQPRFYYIDLSTGGYKHSIRQVDEVIKTYCTRCHANPILLDEAIVEEVEKQSLN